jgi:nitroreductase
MSDSKIFNAENTQATKTDSKDLSLDDPSMSLAQAIKERRSVRGFLDKPVPENIILNIFDLAQQSPSNCNIMPWKVYVASGEKREQISQELVAAVKGGQAPNSEFPPTPKHEGEYRQRQVDCAVELYNNMGIARDDKEGRLRALLRNHELFDAPHIVFVCMEKHFGVSVAVDVGMYAQSLMLAMTAHGLGSCAMGSMRHYPDIPRKILGIPEQHAILFGIAFGYEDESVPANRTRIIKDDISQSVFFDN